MSEGPSSARVMAAHARSAAARSTPVRSALGAATRARPEGQPRAANQPQVAQVAQATQQAQAQARAPTPTRAPPPPAAAGQVPGQSTGQIGQIGQIAQSGQISRISHVGQLGQHGQIGQLGQNWRASTVTAVEAAEEATYWRDHYRSRPYAGPGANHDDYGPAYAYALNAYRQHAGLPFDRLAGLLASEWPAHRGRSSLDWARACPAVRDAWERLHAR